jgi:hypothetical protein
MTYSLALQGLGATGDRFAVGQVVTARFIPRGVNAANQSAVFAALDAAMAQTGVFRSPSYRGWGSGANAGLVVFKASTKTDAYTAQQVADMMKGVVAATTRTLGATRLATSTIQHPTPSGPAVAPASAPPAYAPPGDPGPVEQPPAYAPPAADDGSAAESPGFFTRKVGGVPVWVIGAGVGTLGVVAIGAALLMRKKPARPLTANAKGRKLSPQQRQQHRLLIRAAADAEKEAERAAEMAAAARVVAAARAGVKRPVKRMSKRGPKAVLRAESEARRAVLRAESERQADRLAAARREMAMNPGRRRYRG